MSFVRRYFPVVTKGSVLDPGYPIEIDTTIESGAITIQIYGQSPGCLYEIFLNDRFVGQAYANETGCMQLNNIAVNFRAIRSIKSLSLFLRKTSLQTVSWTFLQKEVEFPESLAD